MIFRKFDRNMNMMCISSNIFTVIKTGMSKSVILSSLKFLMVETIHIRLQVNPKSFLILEK